MEAREDIIHKITEYFGEATGGGRQIDRENAMGLHLALGIKKCTLTPHFPVNIKPERLYKEYCITFLAQLDHHFV